MEIADWFPAIRQEAGIKRALVDLELEPAMVNLILVRPKTMQNVVLAGIVGPLLAAGVALLIEYLDDTVKTPTM